MPTRPTPSEQETIARYYATQLENDAKRLAAIQGPPPGVHKVSSDRERQLWDYAHPGVDVPNFTNAANMMATPGHPLAPHAQALIEAMLNANQQHPAPHPRADRVRELIQQATQHPDPKAKQDLIATAAMNAAHPWREKIYARGNPHIADQIKKAKQLAHASAAHTQSLLDAANIGPPPAAMGPASPAGIGVPSGLAGPAAPLPTPQEIKQNIQVTRRLIGSRGYRQPPRPRQGEGP